VNAADVPDYRMVIKEPMDLRTMDIKLEKDEYIDLDSFKYDVQLIFDNCRFYNQEHTIYYKCANLLEEYFHSRLKAKQF